MGYTNAKIAAFLMACVLLGCPSAFGSKHNNTINGDFYKVTWTSVSRGGNRLIRVTTVPVGDVHCNLEYPWKVKVVTDSGIHFTEETFRGTDAGVFSDKKVVIDLPYDKSTRKGTAQLELKMSMCDDRQCFMKNVPFEVVLP
jgi:hypothetical protein